MEGRCFDRSVGRGWEEVAERLPSVAVVFSLSVVRSRTQLPVSELCGGRVVYNILRRVFTGFRLVSPVV